MKANHDKLTIDDSNKSHRITIITDSCVLQYDRKSKQLSFSSEQLTAQMIESLKRNLSNIKDGGAMADDIDNIIAEFKDVEKEIERNIKTKLLAYDLILIDGDIHCEYNSFQKKFNLPGFNFSSGSIDKLNSMINYYSKLQENPEETRSKMKAALDDYIADFHATAKAAS